MPFVYGNRLTMNTNTGRKWGSFTGQLIVLIASVQFKLVLLASFEIQSRNFSTVAGQKPFCMYVRTEIETYYPCIVSSGSNLPTLFKVHIISILYLSYLLGNIPGYHPAPWIYGTLQESTPEHIW